MLIGGWSWFGSKGGLQHRYATMGAAILANQSTNDNAPWPASLQRCVVESLQLACRSSRTMRPKSLDRRWAFSSDARALQVY